MAEAATEGYRGDKCEVVQLPQLGAHHQQIVFAFAAGILRCRTGPPVS